MTYNVLRGCSLIEIPDVVGTIVSLVYLAIKIGIPVILLIIGMVDLGKAVVAQKEEEIKNAQGLLVKKIISAVIVFVLFTIIQFAINLVDRGNPGNAGMWSCAKAILAGGDETGVCPNGYGPSTTNPKYCIRGANNSNDKATNCVGGKIDTKGNCNCPKNYYLDKDVNNGTCVTQL